MYILSVMEFKVLLAFVTVVISSTYGKVCPNVPTLPDFDSQKYSGLWYSIWESSPPRLPCLHYTMQPATKGFNITMLPYQLGLTADIDNTQNVAEGYTFRANFNKLKDASWNVFATDYTSYAGIFTCKQTDNIDFESVTFISRTNKMSDATVKHLKSVLDGYGVNYSNLQKMIQGSLVCAPGNLIVGEAMKVLVPLFNLSV